MVLINWRTVFARTGFFYFFLGNCNTLREVINHGVCSQGFTKITLQIWREEYRWNLFPDIFMKWNSPLGWWVLKDVANPLEKMFQALGLIHRWKILRKSICFPRRKEKGFLCGFSLSPPPSLRLPSKYFIYLFTHHQY